MKIDLTGKTAWITGSTKGIGQAGAIAFRDAGIFEPSDLFETEDAARDRHRLAGGRALPRHRR